MRLLRPAEVPVREEELLLDVVVLFVAGLLSTVEGDVEGLRDTLLSIVVSSDVVRLSSEASR